MEIKPADLDVFYAIADPTRRRILELLAGADRAVMELVAEFKMKQPSISEHLRVLRKAGLVSARKLGRSRIYRLLPIQFREIRDWLSRFDDSGLRQFNRIEPYLAPALDEPHQLSKTHSQMTMEID